MVETTNGCVENDNCERKLAFGRDSWIFIQAYIFLRLWAMCPKNSLIKKRSNLRLKLYVFIEKSQEEREPQRTMSSLCDWYYFSTCETLDWMKLRYHPKTIISLILVWFYPNMYRTVVLLEILGKMPQISDWNWTLVIREKKAAVWRWKFIYLQSAKASLVNSELKEKTEMALDLLWWRRQLCYIRKCYIY